MIYQLYLENPGLPYLDSRVLASYQEIKDRIVYKLVNTQANRAMLDYLPHMPFHDMSLVCYLLMEQREQGYVTALIHKDHVQAWKIREKELFLAALENTPRLLPPVIQPMSDVLRQLAKEALGENYQKETLDALLEEADKQRTEKQPVFPTLYVLSNPVGVNGAACMTYPHVIQNFAQQLRAAKQAKGRRLDAEEDQTIARTQHLLNILDDAPEFLETFDGELFGELVDKIIVESNERLRFCLINGLKLTENIERTVR